MMVDLQSSPGEPIWPLLAEFMNGILNIELNQHLSVAKWVSLIPVPLRIHKFHLFHNMCECDFLA